MLLPIRLKILLGRSNGLGNRFNALEVRLIPVSQPFVFPVLTDSCQCTLSLLPWNSRKCLTKFPNTSKFIKNTLLQISTLFSVSNVIDFLLPRRNGTIMMLAGKAERIFAIPDLQLNILKQRNFFKRILLLIYLTKPVVAWKTVQTFLVN